MRRTTRKKTAKPLSTPAAPPTPSRPRYPEPPWFHETQYNYGYPHHLRPRQVIQGTWHLPPFQREPVWDAARQVAYCNAVFLGRPVAPILVWQRNFGPTIGDRSIVLDGQQRLTALGAKVMRPDGSLNPPTAARFDLALGRFTSTPDRWNLAPGMIADYLRNHDSGLDFFEEERKLEEAQDPDAATFYWWIHAHGTMSSREIVVHVLDRYMTPEHAIEAFRSINTPGVTFDLADVERLIKAAGTWDPAATMAVAPD